MCQARSTSSCSHHFVVLYRPAKRDPGWGPTYWLGHVTHVVIDETGRESTKRIAFTNLDELPTIIRRCIGLDTVTSFNGRRNDGTRSPGTVLHRRRNRFPTTKGIK